MWKVELAKQALKDSAKVRKSVYSNKVESLLKIIKNNPYQTPPPYEKLQPPKDNIYSRRINVQHRIVYHINDKENLITIYALWSHYE